MRKLAALHCTVAEIGNFVGCSVDTLERRFADILHVGKDEGKISLRRKMYEVAMKGNCSMLIWLSKQYLGMTDRQPDQQLQANYTVVIHEVPK